MSFENYGQTEITRTTKAEAGVAVRSGSWGDEFQTNRRQGRNNKRGRLCWKVKVVEEETMNLVEFSNDSYSCVGGRKVLDEFYSTASNHNKNSISQFVNSKI